MTIYQDYASLKKVGNVRSCRLYYVYFAKEFQAVYFHAGESKYALDVLNSSFIDNVDGITGKGGAFYYRDKSRRAPHNLYTTGENLASAMKTYGYDTKLPENYTSHYRFTAEDSQNLLDQGEVAKKYPYTMLTRSPGLYTMKRMVCITAMNLVINRLTVLSRTACCEKYHFTELLQQPERFQKRNVRYRLSFRWIRNVHHKRKSCPDYMEKSIRK